MTLTAGATFANNDSAAGLHAQAFAWDATLTIVRRDPQSYGVARYVVRDSNGRHGYAFGTTNNEGSY
jgi:hypothetical protein